jgi:hypothetical protein
VVEGPIGRGRLISTLSFLRVRDPRHSAPFFLRVSLNTFHISQDEERPNSLPFSPFVCEFYPNIQDAFENLRVVIGQLLTPFRGKHLKLLADLHENDGIQNSRARDPAQADEAKLDIP